MKVRVTFNLSNNQRCAIAQRTGGDRKASRADCATLLWGLAIADLAVIESEYDALDGSDKVGHCDNCGCEEHLPKRTAFDVADTSGA